MSVNIIATDYTQMSLPSVVDAKIAAIPAGTYNPTAVSGTYFTLPGVYGPGDFVYGVSNIIGTLGAIPPFSTVEFRNAGGIVGTLYSRLGTSVNTPGTFLGTPLATTAWIQVSATGAEGTFQSLGTDTRMVVSYVHEA